MQNKPMPFVLSAPFYERIQKVPHEASDELWFIVNETKILMYEDSCQIVQPKNSDFTRSLYLGVFQHFHVHVAEMNNTASIPAGTVWIDLKLLYGKIDDSFFALAGRAVQLALWDRTHQFCGQCGGKTTQRPRERAKECTSCNLLAFPKISPVMIVLIQKDDEILLARSPYFPARTYSTLAGFVNPGESLEECVQREVFEEVGILVDQITYFGSQPWPFPHSLMLGFTCQWAKGEIVIDPSEIEDAQWFKKDNLPELPTQISIARFLIDSVLNKIEVFS